MLWLQWLALRIVDSGVLLPRRAWLVHSVPAVTSPSFQLAWLARCWANCVVTLFDLSLHSEEGSFHISVHTVGRVVRKFSFLSKSLQCTHVGAWRVPLIVLRSELFLLETEVVW